MCGFRAFLGKGFIVELTGTLGIEAEIELVFPTELETGLAQGVVAELSAGMAFGEVGCVRGNFVGDNAFFDILFVRQAEMFFRSDVTKHRAAEPPDHGRANPAGDVVVTGSNISGKRT